MFSEPKDIVRTKFEQAGTQRGKRRCHWERGKDALHL